LISLSKRVKADAAYYLGSPRRLSFAFATATLAWKLEAVLLTAVFSAKTIVPPSGHEEMKLALVQINRSGVSRRVTIAKLGAQLGSRAG
jgi:hypothetical protein